MAKGQGAGALVAPVKFSAEVRRQLTAAVKAHAPASQIKKIVARLEDVAASAGALSAPDVREVHRVLDMRARAVREVLRAFDPGDKPPKRLVEAHDLADQLLAGELTLRGWDAQKVRRALQEGLAELEQAHDAIAARLAKRRGGRQGDSPASYLVEQAAHELGQAGVAVTRDEDGPLAKVLRVLWPVVLKREGPIELRRWLNRLKSRR